MPLGGSVTYGQASTDGNGYRNYLRRLLISDGYEVDMVGSRKAGSMEDNDNEGWRGYRIDQITEKAKKSVPVYMPNIFTINAGSNDCIQDFEIDQIGERMGYMLEYLWSTCPSSTIILSTLIVSTHESTEQRIFRVNKQLMELAEKKMAEHKRIVPVDMHSSSGPQCSDLVDGTHPHDAGYKKMARIWYQGIQDAASKGFF